MTSRKSYDTQAASAFCLLMSFLKTFIENSCELPTIDGGTRLVGTRLGQDPYPSSQDLRVGEDGAADGKVGAVVVHPIGQACGGIGKQSLIYSRIEKVGRIR